MIANSTWHGTLFHINLLQLDDFPAFSVFKNWYMILPHRPHCHQHLLWRPATENHQGSSLEEGKIPTKKFGVSANNFRKRVFQLHKLMSSKKTFQEEAYSWITPLHIAGTQHAPVSSAILPFSNFSFSNELVSPLQGLWNMRCGNLVIRGVIGISCILETVWNCGSSPCQKQSSDNADISKYGQLVVWKDGTIDSPDNWQKLLQKHAQTLEQHLKSWPIRRQCFVCLIASVRH